MALQCWRIQRVSLVHEKRCSNGRRREEGRIGRPLTGSGRRSPRLRRKLPASWALVVLRTRRNRVGAEAGRTWRGPMAGPHAGQRGAWMHGDGAIREELRQELGRGVFVEPKVGSK